MSRHPKKKAPKLATPRFDLSEVSFSMCGLTGHGECDDGLVMPFTMIETRGLKQLHKELVCGLCPKHRVEMANDAVLAEHLGCRVPRWVWSKALANGNTAYVIDEMKVLRSTARSTPPSELTEQQWPFWMANEKQTWLEAREFSRSPA